MWDWIRQHEELIGWLTLASAAMLLLGIVLVPLILVRMPRDHFLHSPRQRRRSSAHPVLRLAGTILRNLIGGVLVLAGLAMLVLPGQGILTILVGLGLCDFPGKRRLELAILRRPAVRGAIDWIRRRWNRPPIELPEPPGKEQSRPGPD